MKRFIVYALITSIVIGFVVLGATRIRSQNIKIKWQGIEIKSREAKLIDLDNRYQKLIDEKATTEEEKEEQSKQIKELEGQRDRLQQELQVRANKVKAEQEKLAIASKKATGTQTASALSGDKYTWMQQAGIPESDWRYVDYIVSKESSWNPLARNKSSGACSLVQALPCSKLGVNWQDPIVALKWQRQYVQDRYGGYYQAYLFWIKNSWY